MIGGEAALETVITAIFQEKMEAVVQLMEQFQVDPSSIYEGDYEGTSLTKEELALRVDEANKLVLGFMERYSIASLVQFYLHFASLMKGNFVKSAELIALQM